MDIQLSQLGRKQGTKILFQQELGYKVFGVHILVVLLSNYCFLKFPFHSTFVPLLKICFLSACFKIMDISLQAIYLCMFINILRNGITIALLHYNSLFDFFYIAKATVGEAGVLTSYSLFFFANFPLTIAMYG